LVADKIAPVVIDGVADDAKSRRVRIAIGCGIAVIAGIIRIGSRSRGDRPEREAP